MKTNVTRVKTLLAVPLILALPVMVQAQLTITTNNGTITITGYTGNFAVLTIPNFTNGYPVTTIGPHAFKNDYNLTNVTFGTNVTTLEGEAFAWAGLTIVNIPANVTNIDIDVFVGCPLTTITVNSNNPVYASVNGVLFNKQLTTLVQYPINNYATSYMLPASVTSIADSAFVHAYYLQTITVDSNNSGYASVGGVLFNRQLTALLLCPQGFAGSYAIPTGVTSIGDEAFWGCYYLTNISIPNSVTSIGYDVFENCRSLSSVTIPASVVSLGSYAFYSHPWDGNGLTAVYFKGNAPSEDCTVFEGNNYLTIYYLPGTTGWGSTYDCVPTALWNPSIQTTSTSFGVQTNGFFFSIVGRTNIPIVVEGCTNLSSTTVWVPLRSCTLTNGSIMFEDSAWSNHPIMFYRIGSP